MACIRFFSNTVIIYERFVRSKILKYHNSDEVTIIYKPPIFNEGSLGGREL